MARFSWLLIAFACFTFSGCGGGATVDVPDEAEETTTTPIEEDMKDAGMGDMTLEEYNSGGK